uniref:B-cell receptor CD22-like n=1 Tax=Epinephelus lanceolatus TaxID=310571 RepID=UPI0014453A9E|nr:B-cell receptor CD22-like [Epinephelus lanceolatus]
MAVWDKKILILWGFMFLLAGAVGQSVNYPRSVCAMKGSTVTLPCTFKTLASVTENGKEVLIKINRVVWCPNHEICQGGTPSVYDSKSDKNNPRYRYLGDKKGNCTLQITDLQTDDNATFRFRVETNHCKATFTGPPGVKVIVGILENTRMKIKTESNREFKRGERLTLKCNAMCTFHQLEVTWFRDGNTLPETGPTLQLGPLAAKDSGNYTCGLKNNNRTLSQPYSLHVEGEEEAGDVNLPLIAGVVVGVLLALFALVLVLCIIKRAEDENSRHITGTCNYVSILENTRMKIKTESNREFKRGERLTLKCNAMCTFHQLEVTWFRDGNTLPETGPTLQLGPLAAKDSGNYTCGLKNNNRTLSQPYSLHVEGEEEAGDVNLPLIAGVVVGVLLALFALVLVLCIIKRKRAAAAAADQLQPSVESEQKRPDIIYSDIQHPAEQEPQEDISYAAVQFKQKNKARPAEEAEDGVIYSSVANRG